MLKNILVFLPNQSLHWFFEYVYALFHHLLVELKVHRHQILYEMDVQENYQEYFFRVKVFQLLIQINHDERNLELIDYVICIKTSDNITNIKIKCSNGQWFLDGVGRREQIDRFKSLDELIHFYLKHNILVAINGISYHLEQACTSNWFYARNIHQRCEYLSKLVPSPNGQKNGFSLEFELLNQQSESQSTVYHKKNGEKPENRIRNRFKKYFTI